MHDEDFDDVTTGLDDVEQAVREVEAAVQRVEEAVKGKSTSAGYVALAAIGVLIVSWVGDAWHSKYRYALSYGLNSEKVGVDKKPHDCNFMAAPLGEKYCHYERTISTVRWATSTTNQPIVSYDEGKTWSVFEPEAGMRVPQYSTVETVVVNWERKDD